MCQSPGQGGVDSKEGSSVGDSFSVDVEDAGEGSASIFLTS
jgi:hypothetical protein